MYWNGNHFRAYILSSCLALAISGLIGNVVSSQNLSSDSLASLDPSIRYLMSSDHDEKLKGALIIESDPTPARVQALINETRGSQTFETRKQLLQVLERVDADNFADEFLDAFGDWKDGDLRESIRKALLKSSSAKIVNNLVSRGSINSLDQRVVRDIGRTLSAMRNPGAVKSLLDGLNSPNVSIVAGCAAALGAIGTPEVIDGLVYAYPLTSNEQKLIILEAIRRVRNPSSTHAIEFALSQKDMAVELRETLMTTRNILSK